MKIYFCQPGVQAVQNLEDILLGHAARIENTLDLAGIAYTEPFQKRADMPGESPEYYPLYRFTCTPLPPKS